MAVEKSRKPDTIADKREIGNGFIDGQANMLIRDAVTATYAENNVDEEAADVLGYIKGVLDLADVLKAAGEKAPAK